MENFLTITSDNAAIMNTETTGSSHTTDPRYWKPTVKNKTHEYQAQIRILPRGVDGLKNRIDPSAKILAHYLKDKETGIQRSIPCRKNLGPNEPCPICETAWAMFNEGKKQGVAGVALYEAGKAMLPKTNYLINVLVRNDLQQPELNGQVKIWNHTPKMNKILFAPTKVSEDNGKQSIVKKEVFYPYAPVGGRDYAVIVVQNPENGMASYDNSQWLDAPSNIASTEGEILDVLDHCFDLGKIVKDVGTAEESVIALNEFNNAVASKRASISMAAQSVTAGGFAVPPSNSAPALKPSTQGDAKSFFNGGTLNAPQPAFNATPVFNTNPNFGTNPTLHTMESSSNTAVPRAKVPEMEASDTTLSIDDDDSLPF